MNLNIFTKTDCPNCPAAKAIAKKLEKKGAKVIWYDLDEEDGLAESVFCDVLSTPSLIITDDSDNEVKAWRGEVPDFEEISKALKL